MVDLSHPLVTKSIVDLVTRGGVGAKPTVFLIGWGKAMKLTVGFPPPLSKSVVPRSSSSGLFAGTTRIVSSRPAVRSRGLVDL